MSGTGRHIDFTALCETLPQASQEVWKQSRPGLRRRNRLREVFQLLCGALCHFELAAKMGDFPLGNMEALHGGHPLPFEDWLNQDNQLSIQADAHRLTMQYNFPRAMERPKTFLQNMLLGDGALRLTGVWDVLRIIRPTQAHPYRDPTRILNASGTFQRSLLDRPTGNFKSNDNTKRLQFLTILALRDAFMHGEISHGQASKDMRKRWRFRGLWFRGKLEPFLTYSPAVIAEACRDVSEELINMANGYLH